MKRIIFATLTLLVALSFSVASAQGKKAAGNKAGLEQTVNVLFDAIKANNTDKIKPYYTADYTFTGPDGKMLNAADRLKMMKDGTGPMVVNVSDLAVRTYGTTGVVTGHVSTKNPDGSTTENRFTQTWTWQGGKWRLAASQVTDIK
jgi:ketosteroid isomerase-like protein